MSRWISVLLFVYLSPLTGQFSDAAVDLDIERLSTSERQEIIGLDLAIRDFFLKSPWDQEVRDLAIPLDVRIVFESVITSSGEKTFQAQALFTNRLDQHYFARGVQFPYSRGRPITLSPLIDPLNSFLEFYAYLMIAGELDTYDILGGTPYYTKANAIAFQGKNIPNHSRGWDERLTLVEKLASNHDMRRAKAYFYQALDGLASEDLKLDELKGNLLKFLKSIEAVVERRGQERYTAIFLAGHADEIAELFYVAQMPAELQRMARLDPDNERTYKRYLNPAGPGKDMKKKQ